jgi:hypothetical protein
MKHENYKELMELSILNELNEKDRIELENHLLECEECSSEYQEIKKVYSLIINESPDLPTDRDLINSRVRLFNTINSEITELSFPDKIKNLFNPFFTNKYSFAFGSIALMLVGFFIGYLIFNSNYNISPIIENSIDLDKIDTGELKVANVNFPNTFSNDGIYEFKIGDKNPITYKGNLNDIAVQKLLAAALTETDNPGFKIKTATSIREFIPKNFMPDEMIKNAFIKSLTTDSNPGVRKEALQALLKFRFDKEIRDALIFTLNNDENASNRIEAINALLSMNLYSQIVNDTIKNQLEKDIVNEDNEVVKIKTAKLLLGGK